jgi:endonuclease YncB( thermonuclease family)
MVTQIINNDTIIARGRHSNQAVRLLCVSTPKRNEPKFHAAKFSVQNRLLYRTVILETEGNMLYGRYGRLLASIFIDCQKFQR